MSGKMWEHKWSRIPFFFSEDGRPYSRNSLAFMKPKVQHPAPKSSPVQKWRTWQKNKHSEKRNFRLCCEISCWCFLYISTQQILFLGLIHFVWLSHRDGHLQRIRGDAHCSRYKGQFSSFTETQLHVKITAELNCDQFLVFDFLNVNSFSL